VSLRRGGEVAGQQGAREAPSSGEAGVEAIENAYCESNGLNREIGAAQDGLNKRDRGRGQRGR